MKTNEKTTVGGKVIQVFGTTLGDMTVTGVFGFGNRKKGDSYGWQDQERFRGQVEAWTRQASETRGATALRFIYPPKRWDFHVFVKAYSSPDGPAVVHRNQTFNPGWQLTLFIEEDRTRVVVKGIRDLYISRLMGGLGWKQSKYNGPSQAELDARMAGDNVAPNDFAGYLRAEAAKAAAGTLGGGVSGPSSAAPSASTPKQPRVNEGQR